MKIIKATASIILLAALLTVGSIAQCNQTKNTEIKNKNVQSPSQPYEITPIQALEIFYGHYPDATVRSLTFYDDGKENEKGKYWYVDFWGQVEPNGLYISAGAEINAITGEFALGLMDMN